MLSKLFIGNWKPIVCFIVHIFLLWAVFDTYYKSPLVHGMTPHGEMPADVAPASRLVLFVADGLRAHSLYTNTSRTPFLRKIMTEFGTWGVSHTRVPTESRPGHVALIAGFYEDVSAVTKGWRENPVDFDSVFNESRYTWSWGSPDILPMFAKGATGNRVFTSCYDSYSEDFASSDPSKLDTWVFDKVRAFLSSPDESLAAMLRDQKIIFFLHLLGLDTSGHGYKPLSPEYSHNIEVVDQGVSEMYELIEQFYHHDGRTAYIFTSDHGMTNWGSHGAGDPHETMTPIIAWGAGIPSPTEKLSPNAINFDTSETASARAFGRKDVNQVDVAPLMSALLGINAPMNSVGVLPRGYLNVSHRYATLAACSNFKQLMEQMNVQRQRKYDSSIHLFFKDFPALTPSKLKLIMGEIEKLFTQKRYSAAENLCQEWSRTAVDALIYYHQYERPFLTFCVTITFAFLELCVWKFASQRSGGLSHSGKTFAIGASMLTVFVFWFHSFPLERYLYGLTPIFLAALSYPVWNRWILRGRSAIGHFWMTRKERSLISELGRLAVSARARDGVVTILCSLVGIELLVRIFFHRWILSVGLWIFSCWPMLNPRIGEAHRLAWFSLCSVTSVFPFLPTVGKSANPELIFYSSMGVGICCVFVYVIRLHRRYRNLQIENLAIANGVLTMDDAVFALLFLYVLASGCVNLTTFVSLERRRGSPALNRCVSWVILLSSPCLTLLMTKDTPLRLLTLSLSLFCPLALMSVNYEPIFYVCLCSLLAVWLRIEGEVERGKKTPMTVNRPLGLDEIRRAYFFVFFITLAFFGTGNIASINSFDPSFTASFVTVFSPFLMGALLLTKIAIPFFIVCAYLCELETTMASSVGVMFWLIVMISDGMALRFFFLLRDHGSWLDIGTSISHFVISSLTTLIVMILYHLAKLALTKSIFATEDTKWHIL